LGLEGGNFSDDSSASGGASMLPLGEGSRDFSAVFFLIGLVIGAISDLVLLGLRGLSSGSWSSSGCSELGVGALRFSLGFLGCLTGSGFGCSSSLYSDGSYC